MLFHVTATHTEENCPAFNTQLTPAFVQGLGAREEIAKKYNVKLLGFWSTAPGHTFYSLIEANSMHDLDRFILEATPVKQVFTITPVMTADELITLGKELAEAAKK